MEEENEIKQYIKIWDIFYEILIRKEVFDSKELKAGRV